MKIKIILFTLIFLWVAGIFIHFFIPSFNGLFYLLPFLENTYSTVCHQQEEKLLNFNGYKTLVCARCTGIYLGALFSSFGLLFLKLKNSLNIKFLMFASIPMLGDVILYSTGIYTYSKTVALITGLLLGSIGFLYIHEGIMDLFEEKNKKDKN